MELNKETIKKILDDIDLSAGPPEEEPARQYYFMASARRRLREQFAEDIASGEALKRYGAEELAAMEAEGVCGTAVVDEEGRIRQIKEPTSLCIRIARVEAQTKDPQLEELMRHAEEGILIAGAPGSGKTTMLRSCSRILSQQGKRIAVVDERRELWPVSEWGFSSAPPQNCDLLSGYPKAEGILHALRSLSPQLMLCDEVGGEKDAQAVAAGANAGVGMVVTVHARDSSELERRPQTRILLETGAFTRAVFLCGASAPGRIREVAYVDGLS